MSRKKNIFDSEELKEKITRNVLVILQNIVNYGWLSAIVTVLACFRRLLFKVHTLDTP